MLRIDRLGNDFIVTPCKVKSLNATLSKSLEKQLIQLMDQQGIVITLDLTEIKYIDSIGFATLLSIGKAARSANCTFQLYNVSPDLQKLLNLLKLGRMFRMVENRPEKVETG
ncbi:MAG: STAS domain-containing protein [Bacteroidales bacterium]|nr:MAG: STAS domain-containing protein [Bacteroidales bacterium]